MSSILCGNCKQAFGSAGPNCGCPRPAASLQPTPLNVALLVLAIGATLLVTSLPFLYGVYEGFTEYDDVAEETRRLQARPRGRFVSDPQAEKNGNAAATPSAAPHSETRAAAETESQRSVDAISREKEALAR